MTTNNQMLDVYLNKELPGDTNVLSAKNSKEFSTESPHFKNMKPQIEEAELLPAFNLISKILKEKNNMIKSLQKSIVELKSQLYQQKKLNKYLIEKIGELEQDPNKINDNIIFNSMGCSYGESNSETNQLNHLKQNFWKNASNKNKSEKMRQSKTIKNIKYGNLVNQNSFIGNINNLTLTPVNTPDMLYKRKFDTNDKNYIKENSDYSNYSANPKEIRKNYLKEVKSRLDSDVYKLFLQNIKLLADNKNNKNEETDIIVDRIKDLFGEMNKDLFDKFKVLFK